MASSRKPYVGQITFQISPEIQQELLWIAKTLGLGTMSSLARMIITESLPAFRTRAQAVEEAARKYREAE